MGGDDVINPRAFVGGHFGEGKGRGQPTSLVILQGCHASALADHVSSTGHNIKWDHFDILATGKSDLQCEIKETLLIDELKPSLNENVGNEKLFFY